MPINPHNLSKRRRSLHLAETDGLRILCYSRRVGPLAASRERCDSSIMPRSGPVPFRVSGRSVRTDYCPSLWFPHIMRAAKVKYSPALNLSASCSLLRCASCSTFEQLRRPESTLYPPAETGNQHLTGAGEFSTCEIMRNFQGR
jgi:hypothetical protein